jgi:hypothetical protein
MNLNNTFYIEANFTPSLFDTKVLYTDDFLNEIKKQPSENIYNILTFSISELDALSISLDSYKEKMLSFNEYYLSKVNNLVIDVLPEVQHKIEMYSYYLEMKKYDKK